MSYDLGVMRYELALPAELPRPPSGSAIGLSREPESLFLGSTESLTANDWLAYHALFTRWIVLQLARSESPGDAMVALNEMGSLVGELKIRLREAQEG